MIDIIKARRETPGCTHVVHFNNAGASLLPSPVLECLNDYIKLETLHGGYEAADLADQELQNVYQSAARLVGCAPQEIAFTENATRAWEAAFYSVDFQPGDRIVTSDAEYCSNYIAMLQVSQKTGAIIDVVSNDEHGQLCLNDLQNKLTKKTKIIAVTHVPTQGGLINPAQEVGKIANSAGIFYLLDATQTVGQMPVDVQQIGCDALCATGRKYLRAPRGTGFLYVNQKYISELEPPVLDVQAATWTALNTYEIKSDASRFETWEVSYANKLALGRAIEYALEWGVGNIWDRIQHLSKLMREKLVKIPGLQLQDMGEHKCGIVTFTIKGRDPVDIKMQLRRQNINVSVSKAEYARLDMDARGLASIVRASVHYYNTEEEIDLFCKKLKE